MTSIDQYDVAQGESIGKRHVMNELHADVLGMAVDIAGTTETFDADQFSRNLDSKVKKTSKEENGFKDQKNNSNSKDAQLSMANGIFSTVIDAVATTFGIRKKDAYQLHQLKSQSKQQKGDLLNLKGAINTAQSDALVGGNNALKQTARAKENQYVDDQTSLNADNQTVQDRIQTIESKGHY
ncbi:MAG: hypothetical protein ACO3K7_04730 [Candidatus Marinamargulisbacteria bacterium]